MMSLSLRVETNPYANAVNGRAGAGRAGTTAEFVPAGLQQAAKPQMSAPIAAPANIGSLLALQMVDDALQSRKKAVRRGKTLLDTLDAIKTDLLVGRVDPERLDGLMGMVGDARDRGDPELDGLLDDIELRVRVELAKFGRFAS